MATRSGMPALGFAYLQTHWSARFSFCASSDFACGISINSCLSRAWRRPSSKDWRELRELLSAKHGKAGTPVADFTRSEVQSECGHRHLLSSIRLFFDDENRRLSDVRFMMAGFTLYRRQSEVANRDGLTDWK